MSNGPSDQSRGFPEKRKQFGAEGSPRCRPRLVFNREQFEVIKPETDYGLASAE